MKRVPARLWLYPARTAPIVLVVRRKPHRWWHFLRWNTETDEIVPGAWHNWLCYPNSIDISADGEFFTTMLGWGVGRGVATVPDLVPACWWSDNGSWGQAGAFLAERRVSIDLSCTLEQVKIDPRWEIVPLDTQVIHHRLQRDGWIWSEGRWQSRPSPEHPALEAIEVGLNEENVHGFEFKLDGLPDLSWAWCDYRGQLIAARKGSIERYTLDDLKNGRCSFCLDLNSSEPPEIATTRATIPDLGL